MIRTMRRLMPTMALLVAVCGITGCPLPTSSYVSPFSVYPLAFNFGNDLDEDVMYIASDGAAVSWEITGLPAWLSVSPASGTTTSLTPVTLRVDRTQVQNDTQSFEVTSSAGDFTIWVTVGGSLPSDTEPGDVVPGDNPILEVTGDSVGDNGEAVVQIGATDTVGQFTVANAGTGTLTWYLPEEEEDGFPEWLIPEEGGATAGLSPTGGTVGATPQTVTVTIRRLAELDAGQITHTFTIMTLDGQEATIRVAFVMPIRPIIGVSLTGISYSSEISMNFGTTLDAGEFYVGNLSEPGNELNYVVTSDQDCWLFATPATGRSYGLSGGVDGQRVGVAVYRGGLSSDADGGILTVSAYELNAQGEIEIREDVTPATVSISVEAPVLSIDSAVPWMVIPSQLRFPFIMRDSRDAPVTPTLSLTNPRITIFEDGVALDPYETSQVVTDTYRINLAVLMDYSGSMLSSAQTALGTAGDPTALQNVYEQTVIPEIINNTTDLPANTSIGLFAFYSFDLVTPVDVIQDFTTNRGVLETQLRGFSAPQNGPTQILAAIDFTSYELYEFEQGGTGDQVTGYADGVINAILLISDGQLTTPSATEDIIETTERAVDRQARVFSVSWGTSPNHALNAQLASETIGQFYPSGTTCQTKTTKATVSSMSDRLGEVTRDLASHYLLSYTTVSTKESIPTYFEAQVNTGESLISGTSPEYDLNMQNIAPVGGITVTAPNGLETWTVGSTESITWTSTGSIGDVTIVLYKGGSQVLEIVADTTNDGLYDWTIPSGLPADNDYTVRVFYNTGFGEISDFSDYYFSIN